ncbi:hypothetical protein E4U26_005034, partial [Claviceps purpurea]
SFFEFFIEGLNCIRREITALFPPELVFYLPVIRFPVIGVKIIDTAFSFLRSSPEDARAIGQFICDKLRSAANPALIQVWLPLGGISLFSVPGGPFYDADADAVLFDTIREGLRSTGIRIVEDAGSINDGAFAARIVAAMAELMGL